MKNEAPGAKLVHVQVRARRFRASFVVKAACGRRVNLMATANAVDEVTCPRCASKPEAVALALKDMPTTGSVN